MDITISLPTVTDRAQGLAVQRAFTTLLNVFDVPATVLFDDTPEPVAPDNFLRLTSADRMHFFLGLSLREDMRQVLEAAGATEDCENGEVDGFWRVADPVADTLVEIVWYTDGGDAFRPAGLFYRVDVQDRQRTEWVHIPPTRAIQEIVLFGDGSPEAYLTEILADKTAWVPLASALRGPKRMEPIANDDLDGME